MYDSPSWCWKRQLWKRLQSNNVRESTLVVCIAYWPLVCRNAVLEHSAWTDHFSINQCYNCNHMTSSVPLHPWVNVTCTRVVEKHVFFQHTVASHRILHLETTDSHIHWPRTDHPCRGVIRDGRDRIWPNRIKPRAHLPTPTDRTLPTLTAEFGHFFEPKLAKPNLARIRVFVFRPNWASFRDPEGGGPKGGGPRVGAPKFEGPKTEKVGANVGRPKISRFFHLPPPISFFLPSLGCLLVELWPRFKDMDHPKCTFGLLWGHSVPAPAALQAAGVSHNDPREPKRTLWVDLGHEPLPQFHKKTSQEKEERTKLAVPEGKKRAKFWAVQQRAGPAEGRVQRRSGPKMLKTPQKMMNTPKMLNTPKNVEHTHTPLKHTQILHTTTTKKRDTPNKCKNTLC